MSLGGAFHYFGSDEALAFHPLRDIDTEAGRARAQSWILGVIRQEGVALDSLIKDAMWSALENMADAPVRERTLIGLPLLLQRAYLRDALNPSRLTAPMAGYSMRKSIRWNLPTSSALKWNRSCAVMRPSHRRFHIYSTDSMSDTMVVQHF